MGPKQTTNAIHHQAAPTRRAGRRQPPTKKKKASASSNETMTSQFCGYVPMPGRADTRSGMSAAIGYTQGSVMPTTPRPSRACSTQIV